jgi:hypothetical protein
MSGEVAVASRQASSAIKWTVIIVNLALGTVLWFGYFTDYSLAGVVLDLAFPPAVGLVGLVSMLWLAARSLADKRRGCLSALLCLPSFAGGCLPVALTALMILPPFTLGFMFAVDEMAGETRIQQAVSPDGSRVAEVYFRGVGAYSGGNGRIFVRVKPRWFPLIERDIYYLSRSYASEETEDYLHWIDDETLFISETGQEVKVGVIGFEIPSFLLIPILLIQS